MFVNIQQVKRSLAELSAVHPFYGIPFLAFKKASLPVNDSISNLNFTTIVNDILFRYFKPLHNHDGFYSPFLTSNKANRWQDKRYASTTLQRITVDTFGAAFIHPKSTQTWGWKGNYIETLMAHLPEGRKIPIFHLAVWIFKQDVWSENTKHQDIIRSFISMFSISISEFDALFDTSIPDPSLNWLQDEPISDAEILDLIGYPEDAEVTSGAVLKSLELTEIGPATHFDYRPAERLNIITGDNSSGKSFLFDCIWWALTNSWVSDQPLPRSDAQLKSPRISAEIKISSNTRTQKVTAQYDWLRQRWKTPKVKTIQAGLAIYARYDGSFAVWDSTLNDLHDKSKSFSESEALILSRDDLWRGLESSDRRKWLCNGIIRDWVSWQLSGPRYEREWQALKACLKMLSPSGESLAAGQPTRISVEDAREIPTIIMPYGPVPLIYASAGVQRIVALAYVLVWSWFRHSTNSELLRQEPQRNLVLIVDEVEAHLHPRWQKTIVPALMSAVQNLSSSISPQIHLATHSPMVMASAETIFDDTKDDFHHLRLVEREIILEELPFHKQGTSDRWLMSEAFDETVPRSSPAEKAIKEAVILQLAEFVSEERVREVDNRLKMHLDEMDDFWPRWTYFAKQFGIK